MNKSYILAGALILGLSGSAQAMSDSEANHWADAIKRAENSQKYPYGIKSVDTHGDEAYARKICLNTVRNNEKRWIKAGKPGTYIEFLANRYCPVGAGDDPTNLNKNWVKNVSNFLKD